MNCYVCLYMVKNASHDLYGGDRGHDLTEGRVQCTFLDSCVCVCPCAMMADGIGPVIFGFVARSD